MLLWLRAMWDGMRLVCPACRRGRMYRNLQDLNERCPECGVVFERQDGEFLGAMVVAYTVLALVVIGGYFLVQAVADLSATAHIVIWSAVSLLLLVFFYRNMKGIWIGLLHAVLGLGNRE